jgi:hypothetical protein
MSGILRYDPPGRGFFVFLDYVDDEGFPVLFTEGVDSGDAFAAASAILRPMLAQRPELACRTLGAMVHNADSGVCERCTGEGPCMFGVEPEDSEGH